MANSLKAKDLARLVLYKVHTGEDVSQVFTYIETYLEKMNRLDLYPLVLKYTDILYRQEASKDSVQIRVAHHVKPGTVKEIVDTLTDEKPPHDETLDTDLIGGFEAVYKDRKVGINFKNNLESFKKHLSH